MNPILLKFSLCKIGKWALYRRPNGSLFVHRPSFQTTKNNEPFMHKEVILDWPCNDQSIPEKTRTEFTSVANEMTKGLT